MIGNGLKKGEISMVKNINKIIALFLIAIMFVGLFDFGVYASSDENNAKEEFEKIKNTKVESNYDLYIGEEIYPTSVFENSYVINTDNYSSEDNEIYAKITTSNSSVAKKDGGSIIGKKAGTATITMDITYKEETIKKSFKVTVKKSSASTELESSVNDVETIVDNKVLLANGEIWSLNSSATKLKSRVATNVKTYLEIVIRDSSDKQGTSATAILRNSNVLTLKNAYDNKSKKVKNVKKVVDSGFLTTNGTLYRFTMTNSGVIGYEKVAANVTDVFDGEEALLYVKNKKTYIDDKNKLVYNGIITNAGKNSNWILTKSGYIYSYSKNNNKYTAEKINNKKVKSIISVDTVWPIYKATDGKIYEYATKVDYAVKNEFDIRNPWLSSATPYTTNYIKLRTNNNVYLHDVKIMDNVKQIYQGYVDGEYVALIVRKDGSIWNLTINGKASLTKVRSGKMSAKKISTPTNVKVKKSGTKNAKVSWTKVGGASKYTVYRATSKNGTYKKIGTTTSDSYIDKTTKKGKTYYYKIVANHSNKNYNSSKTDAVKIKIK